MIDALLPETLFDMYEMWGEETIGLSTQFFRTAANEGTGDIVAWDIYEYGRDKAPINEYGAPPHVTKPPVLETKTAKAITASEEIKITPVMMNLLRAPGTVARNRGLDMVNDAMKQLRLRIEKLKTHLCFQCLGFGANEGKLTFRREGLAADTQIDLGFVAANHAATISDDWDTVTDDILGDLEKAKALAETACGRVPDTWMMNRNTVQYPLKNTKIGTFSQYNLARSEAMLQNDLPRIAGLDAIVSDAGYVPDGGSFTMYMADNAWSIFPADSTYRKIVECKPASMKCDDNYRGILFNSFEDDSIESGVRVQYAYTFLPVLEMPGEIVFDLNCTA